MNAEFVEQYAHIWRVFERLVNDFDDDAWLHTGRKTITPAHLSFHILKAVKYYIRDASTVEFASGKKFEVNSETIAESELPSREDMVICIREFARKTEEWITNLDLAASNEDFKWAGKTKLSVVIFLLKHNVFHIGELSSLLNESKQGDAEDNYVKALNQ